LSFFFSFSLDLYLFYFQVICLPHNLQIVDYVAGLVGSIHDSTAFASSRIAKDPASFFAADEWMWADSAYACRPWCIPPFKKPVGESLTRFQKKFNYHLSTVSFWPTMEPVLIKQL
jgi:hypothetical protein